MMSVKKYIPQALKDKIKNSLLYAHIRVNILKKPIRIWFFREPGFLNFGDELTTDIIERLFNKKCELVNIDDADLYAVGSIVEIVDREKSKKSYVWGSGFISEGGSVVNDSIIFKATRGYYSRRSLPKKYQHIAVGDPGLLSNLIYKNLSTPTDCIGIIPHYNDSDSEILDKAKNNKHYKVISVRDTPENVIRELASCRVILSSSLHGLIVADSFGIPNMHMPISDKLAGGDYKFKDYYSSIDKDYQRFNKDDLYDERKIETVIDGYIPVAKLNKIQQDLIKSFPF